jgi:transcriptional regulator with XRE-family HTH domain
MSLDHHAVSLQLKQRRLSCQLSQRDLALRSGVAYGTLRRLESTGQGSLKDYFQLQTAFDQMSKEATSSMAEPSIALAPSPSPVRQRIRKPRAPGPSPSNIQNTITATPSLPTLSQKISLDFPYDWSNPNISEEALIAKVLDKARFMDVSRVFAYFGHERVKAVAQDFSIDLQHGVLGALMPGIERGALHV